MVEACTADGYIWKAVGLGGRAFIALPVPLGFDSVDAMRTVVPAGGLVLYLPQSGGVRASTYTKM